MSSEGLRVGVVGVGSLGYHHARILRDVDGARLEGIFDTAASRLREVSADLGLRAFPSLPALLAEVDAVVVSVPTSDHAAVSLAAIERGASVLIEKPIASTLEQADEIIEKARRAGVLIATGHVERFNEALRACEPYLESPRFIESHRLAPFAPRGTDVAVVLDLMIHDIDLVLGLAGSPVVQVDAVGVPVLTPSIDIANARIRFGNGAVANITASRVSRERMRKVRVFQPSGYLSLDLAAGTGEFLRLRPEAILGAGADGSFQIDDIVERIELQGDGREPLRAELESFVQAVRGEGPLVVSGEDGRRALEVALDIVEKIDRDAFATRT